jgi:hypothetical protein
MPRQQADSNGPSQSLAERRGGALGWQLSQKIVCACAVLMWIEEGASCRRDRPFFSGGLFLRSHNHQGTGKRKAGQIVAVSIPDSHDSCLELSR